MCVDTGPESRRFCPSGMRGSSETQYLDWGGPEREDGIFSLAVGICWRISGVLMGRRAFTHLAAHWSFPPGDFIHSFGVPLVSLLGPTCTGHWEQ